MAQATRGFMVDRTDYPICENCAEGLIYHNVEIREAFWTLTPDDGAALGGPCTIKHAIAHMDTFNEEGYLGGFQPDHD